MILPVFENIHQTILDKLHQATTSIQILMAWFTDQKILDLLLEKVKQGVHVELVLLDHENNKKKVGESSNIGLSQFDRFKLDLNLLKRYNAEIVLIDAEAEFFMHSKFCIIDNRMVITGSYNWTYPAQKNIENIVIIEDSEIADLYLNEFRRVKSKKHQILLELGTLPRCSIMWEISSSGKDLRLLPK